MHRIRQRLLQCALSTCTLASLATPGWAVPVTVPDIEMSIWGYRPGDPPGPGQLLGVATQDVAVNGVIRVEDTLGRYAAFNQAATVSAEATEDGKTFWVHVLMPNNYQSTVNYIGGRAEVRIEQRFRKDDPAAFLRYTFNRTSLFASVDPEFGPACRRQSGSAGDCIQGSIDSFVELRDSTDTLVWLETNGAFMSSRFSRTNTGPAFGADFYGNWPWSRNDNPVPGTFGIDLGLVGNSVTREVDLSHIDLDEEFTLVYYLRGWILDESSDVGLMRRGVATSRDPQQGNTGSNLDWSGLTVLGAARDLTVPEPASAVLVLAALAGWAGAARRRARAPGPALAPGRA